MLTKRSAAEARLVLHGLSIQSALKKLRYLTKPVIVGIAEKREIVVVISGMICSSCG